MERWSPTLQNIVLILFESQNNLKSWLVKQVAWFNLIEYGVPCKNMYSCRNLITVFAEVDDVIFAEGNLENLSMQSKIYLFDPQYESKGPAKPKLSSSFASNREESR